MKKALIVLDLIDRRLLTMRVAKEGLQIQRKRVTTTHDESVADIGEESVHSKKPHWMQVCESMPQSDTANNGEN